ncbi:MAG: hypothetical protein A9Z00_04735 [Thermobacillus sp. ZCTH02-B1]|nr:MAG: hypothetical protein A9Z00_04735 [Thermobacillus sp. ZCTH02-B1]
MSSLDERRPDRGGCANRPERRDEAGRRGMPAEAWTYNGTKPPIAGPAAGFAAAERAAPQADEPRHPKTPAASGESVRDR